jgi:putative ABC transport system permease protein
MRADLIAAVRALRASGTFTVVAVVILALGIGASTAIFSVVDAVVLRGLPFDEHDRLVAVGTRRPLPAGGDPARDPQQLVTASPQDFMDWDQRQQVFESMAATTTSSVTLGEPGAEPEDLRALRATADTFDVLRIGPALGRPFTAEHEVEGRHRVAVLSDALWRRRFGSDPSIVGRTITLDGGAFEVLGVMPPDTTHPVGAARATDIYVPFVVPASERIRRPHDQNFYLQVVGRLKPGTTVEQAEAQLAQIGAALREEHPEWNKDTLVGVRPLVDHIVGSRTKSWMLMLLGAVGLVLLIACVNVATLQLARATARTREVAVRAALGASRWRLIRQLLVENVVLAGLGTACAVVLAWWGVQVLRNAMPEGVARVSAIAIDLRVLAVATAAALATGILTGVVPALQLSKPDLTHALKDGTRGAIGTARHRFGDVLVVTEVALAVVLLVGASLFIGSFVTLMRIDPGFDTRHVLTAQVFPRFEPGQPPGDHSAEFQEIVDRISGAQGVVHASYVIGGMPLGGAMNTTRLTVAGQDDQTEDTTVSQRRVTPEYHRALGIPLTRGRFFETADREGSAPVVIVNEAVARRFFPGQDPLGQSLNVADADRVIVGIVGDIHQTSLEAEPMPEIYLALAQSGRGAGELIIRTSEDPYAVLPAVKSAVAQVLPDVPLRNVRTMDEVLARRVAQRKLNMLLLGLFGVLGLVISAVGIYGTLAYTVAQRTREIGVRMALGASRSSVVTMVLAHAGMLVALGMAIGGMGAWSLAWSARAFLFGIDATDARAFVAALAALAATALLASAIPARRAASVDPAEALRTD